jgi:hypothetical protein
MWENSVKKRLKGNSVSLCDVYSSDSEMKPVMYRRGPCKDMLTRGLYLIKDNLVN